MSSPDILRDSLARTKELIRHNERRIPVDLAITMFGGTTLPLLGLAQLKSPEEMAQKVGVLLFVSGLTTFLVGVGLTLTRDRNIKALHKDLLRERIELSKLEANLI